MGRGTGLEGSEVRLFLHLKQILLYYSYILFGHFTNNGWWKSAKCIIFMVAGGSLLVVDCWEVSENKGSI